MRKLGKTFTKRHAFKRKLQTDPDILRLYNKREKAIGSIPAAKDVALYETNEPLSVQLGANIHHSDAAKIELIHRGDTSWPRRVMYAEQIPDLRNSGRDVWVVNLNVKLSGSQKVYEVRVRHLDFPMIVVVNRMSPHLKFVPADDNELHRIDQQNDRFYYLSGWTELKEESEPWDVWSCGVCPTPHTPFSATFYDREVAQLYATSLKREAAHQGLSVG